MLIILFFLILTGAFPEEPWRTDAERANGYFWARDYNAAWVFYERALARGCADGVVLFRAGKSFLYQDLIDDPEFSEALFAAAHHFLLEDYPDDTAIELSQKHFDPKTVVNRRFLKKLYKRVGGDAPKINFSIPVFSEVKGFFARNFAAASQFISIIRSGNLKSALTWARPRVRELLTVWFMISLFTGILLPVIMAVAVSSEGRKSYVTAYACLIHWGCLGIHRFYLGRRTSGLVWLLTGGLLGFGVFFDIFLTGAYVRFWNEDNRDASRHRMPRQSRSKPSGKLKVKKLKKADSREDFSLSRNGSDFNDLPGPDLPDIDSF